MEKYYKISESELKSLLAARLETIMNNVDGVDSWGWHNTSYNNIVKKYYPNELSDEEAEDLYFSDVADAIIASGEYEEVE